jgi:hypothetical protein
MCALLRECDAPHQSNREHLVSIRAIGPETMNFSPIETTQIQNDIAPNHLMPTNGTWRGLVSKTSTAIIV